MQVIAECKCPICDKPGSVIYFHIKAGNNSELRFRCSHCRIYFTSLALAYKIDTDKATVSFSQVTSSNEIIWDKTGFNPSER